MILVGADMPTKKAKSAKTKASDNPFKRTADKLREHAKNEQVDVNTPRALLRIIADVFESEGK